MRVVPLLLLGILIGAVVWFARPSSPPSGGTPDLEPSGQGGTQEAPHLEGAPGADPDAAGADSPDGDPSPTTPPAATPKAERALVLEIEIDGMAPSDVSAARITARPVGPRVFELPETLPAPEAGRPLVHRSVPYLVHLQANAALELALEHDHYLLTRASVTGDAEALQGTGDVVRRVTLTARRATVLTGRVLMPDGVTPLGGAHIQVFREEAGVLVFDDSTATLGDGTWRSRLPAGGRYVVAVVAQGTRVSHAAVQAPKGSLTRVPDLTVQPGASIAGEVRMNGAPAQGHVLGRAVVEEGEWSFPDADLLWDGTAFHRLEVRASSGRDGRFRLDGLSNRDMDLSAGIRQEVVEDGEAPLTRVRAPAEGVILDLTRTILALRPRFRGVPVDNLTLNLEHDLGSWGAMFGKMPGEVVEIVVEPGATLRLTANTRDAEAIHRTVVVPEGVQRHEIVLAFDERKPRATLRLVRGADAPWPERLGIRIPTQQTAFQMTRDVDPAPRDGEAFVVDDLPIGSHTLHLVPGGLTDTQGFLRPVDVHLDVEDAKPRTRTVTFLRGGRVTLALRDPDGLPMASNVILRPADGRPLEVTGVALRGGGWSSRPGGAPENATVHLHPVLAAGDYTLVLSAEGHLPAEFDLTITVGKTTHIEHTFVPRR